MTFRFKHLKQFGYSRNPYLLYRVDIPGKHSHLASKHVCKNLMRLLNKGIKPHSDYLLESARKLLTEEEFSRLKEEKRKQKYYNSNGKRGIRK